jgi:large subunit ribosomal protein L21
VIGHLKGDKVIVFKKKRRKGYRVKNGHRQALTELVIENIQASGAKAKTEKAAKPEAAKAKAAAKPAAKKAAPKAAAVDYSKMTVAELKAEAKKKGVEGISAMKKADLITALSK